LFKLLWKLNVHAVKDLVGFGLENQDLDKILYIGDEISRKKGHVYHTQVYDLTEKRLLWSSEGRSSETLERFFDQLGEERSEKIEAVCCDTMS
jgi:transposase